MLTLMKLSLHSMFHDISSEKWCASIPYYIEGTDKMLYVSGPKY